MEGQAVARNFRQTHLTMPRATTLPEIKNYAEAAERALFKAHESVGGRPTMPRSDLDNDELWIICNFNRGPASDHRYRRPDGNWDRDTFRDCVIEWELSVPRIRESWNRETFVATYSLFAQEATRIELAMDISRWEFLNAQLPFHHFTKLIPMGTVQGFDPSKGQDVATVRFGCWFAVKPDAWPLDPLAYTNPTLPPPPAG